ncbi:MAG: O-antigen ligase family protein [Bryobacteraceae bacterium]
MSLFLLLVYFVCAYTRPMDFFPELAPYRIMLWLGAMCGAAAVGGLVLREERLSLRTPQIFLMVALLFAVVISRIAQGWFGGGLLAFTNFGTTAAVFFLIVMVVSSIRKLAALALAMVLCSVFLAGQAIAAYHFGYDAKRFVISQAASLGDEVAAPADTNSDDEDDRAEAQDEAQEQTQEQTQDSDRPRLLRVRSVGFLADPNDFAQALLMVLPMLGLAWRPSNAFRNFLLVLIPGAILLYAVYLTHSRGALVGLAVMLFMAARQRWGTIRAIVAAAVLVALGALLQFGGGRSFSMQEASNAGRLDAWSAGLVMFRQQPLFGVGYSMFTDHNELTAHNSFVLCFAELGLFGYFFWLALLLITGYQLSDLMQERSEEEGGHSIARWAGIIQMSFYSFLATAFFLSRTYNVGLYILLAFTVVLVEIARQMGQPVRIPAFPSWFSKVGVLEFASIVAVYGLVRVFHALR